MLSKPPKSAPHVPSTRRGLGLTLLTRAKNPSSLVRALYLQPTLAPHTFLSGATAENIGASLGETLVDSKYFFTERRWREHRRGLGLPEEPLPQETTAVDEPKSPTLDELPTGTVGAVALDINGCIAVLTSTGGKTNKLVGRVGDTPVMGSGFWAEKWSEAGWVTRIVNSLSGRSNKKAVGISGTGDGDVSVILSFICLPCTYSTLRKSTSFATQRRQPLLAACNTWVNRSSKQRAKLFKSFTRVVGWEASLPLTEMEMVIVIVKNLFQDMLLILQTLLPVAMPLNCSGMYRGVIREDGVPKTAIFSDDVLS